VYVAELARLALGLSDDVVDRHRRTLGHVGLPTTYAGADFDALLAAMRVDKKARGSQLRFVVLEGLARPRVLAGPDEAHLRRAFELVQGGVS
jgi:3-dehydroquinate synthase